MRSFLNHIKIQLKEVNHLLYIYIYIENLYRPIQWVLVNSIGKISDG